MAKNTRVVVSPLPDFVFVQSSQWLPGSAESLEEGTDFILSKHPSVVALTEIFSKARSRTLEEAGYTVHHEVGTDPAVLWDTKVWTALYAETEQVTDQHYWTQDGKATKPQKACFVILEHNISKHRLLVVATHYPPHTEGRGGPGGIWRPESIRRWTVGMSAMAGIRKRRSELAKLYHFDAQIITADWNLNIMRTAVRAWFKTQFPSATPNFPTTYSGAGTLGKGKGRVVDFSLLRHLKILKDPEVMKVVSSDHKSASTWLSFTELPKNPVVVPPVIPPTPEPTVHECPLCHVSHSGVVS